ncbi:MAG: GMC family oxidoreductase [Henriciella sp.]|nr:GMC family oxidoreductase [Henriciella sp.]
MNLSEAIKRGRSAVAGHSAQLDAIIVGAGAAGGFAAALLCEAGLKTLVLDAGSVPSVFQRPLTRTTNEIVSLLANPDALRWIPPRISWKGRQLLKLMGKRRQPIQSQCYAWEGLPNGFVDDLDQPYETPSDRPFNWIRVRGLGGRMVVPSHGKQYLRHGPADFAPEDDLSPAWPFAPGTLDPFYAQAEARLQLKGQLNGSPWIPDSELGEVLTPDKPQAKLMQVVTERWPDAAPMLGRFTEPMPALDQAAATGNLSLAKGAAACEVITENGRAAGVKFVDQSSGSVCTARAPVVFLCASSLETTRLLLLSREAIKQPEASESDPLGRYVMDHVSVKAEGMITSWGTESQDFNLGNCVYLPRFERRDGDISSTRGYGMRLYQSPGPQGLSYYTAVSDAEMYPRADNYVRLADRKDHLGIPILHIEVSLGPREKALAEQQIQAVLEVSDLVEADLQSRDLSPSVPGAAIHEVGGARMGTDPASSVVDPDNQVWDVPGLYVTDGAAFPSIGIQNPTLTILALTARACAKVTTGR